MRITGQAMGSSTDNRMRQRGSPIPRADSITVGGTEHRPTMALPMIGCERREERCPVDQNRNPDRDHCADQDGLERQ